MTPFLKWPGGKRWFVAHHASLLPAKFNRYLEPFLGSGSVFFHLCPTRAILSDLNAELIATYKAIRDKAAVIERHMVIHQSNHGSKYYYQIKKLSRPRPPTAQAARLLYLNRTCFNGIYRVNLAGDFNVPKGSRDSVILNTDDFKKVASLLAKTEILHADFERVIARAKKGDLIFADPPYTVSHNVNGFIKYNERLFSWEDQVRLADALHLASARGAQIVSTNANHASVRKLYRERGFSLIAVSRYSSVSAAIGSRKLFGELVIRS